MEVGFYGKLPSHGDFLRRRVSDRFVAVWDGWLQECIAASRAVLEEQWLDVYLTSPAWRFACAPGVFGTGAVIGLMVPSVDRVGRYFYLALVAELPSDTDVVEAATSFESFFDGAERLAIETLEAEQVEFESFDQNVMQLGSELHESWNLAPRVELDAQADEVLNGVCGPWQIGMGSIPQMAPLLQKMTSRRLEKLYDPLVLWWTDGSSNVEPSCLISKGLPNPDAFAALLDGQWTRSQWHSIEAHAIEKTPVEEALVDDPTPPRFRSAGASDVGRVRSINQDCWLERSDVGLWVVADGLGGHSDGEVASRMVCDALADFVPEASFEHMVGAVGERLQAVNAHLVRAAYRGKNGVVSGSTVVALMVRGTRCAIVWAGDSRVYRARGGRLEQLTKDHSVAAESGGLTVPSNVITRAIGGEEDLTLDVFRERVKAGDRFLLCSDGLTRMVPEPEIRAWMDHTDIRAAVDGLIDATLAAGAPDNVTVVIVEAYS